MLEKISKLGSKSPSTPSGNEWMDPAKTDSVLLVPPKTCSFFAPSSTFLRPVFRSSHLGHFLLTSIPPPSVVSPWECQRGWGMDMGEEESHARKTLVCVDGVVWH